MVNEGGGGAGPGRDPGDPHLVDAVGGDQVAGGLEDPLPGALRRGLDSSGQDGSAYAAASATPASARTAAAALRPFSAMTLPAGWVAAPHM